MPLSSINSLIRLGHVVAAVQEDFLGEHLLQHRDRSPGLPPTRSTPGTCAMCGSADCLPLKRDLHLRELNERNLHQLGVGLALQKDVELLLEPQAGGIKRRVGRHRAQRMGLLGQLGCRCRLSSWLRRMPARRERRSQGERSCCEDSEDASSWEFSFEKVCEGAAFA